MPDIDAPSADLPTGEVPSLDAPSLDIKPPAVDATIPEMSAPGATLLGVDAPDTGIPSPTKVPGFDASLPEAQIPRASLPDTGMSASLPGLDAPQVPGIGEPSMPSVDGTLPGLFSCDVCSRSLCPTVHMNQFEINMRDVNGENI